METGTDQPASTVPEYLDPTSNNGDLRPDAEFRRGWNACREAMIASSNPRPNGVCPHGVSGVHECKCCADEVPAHIARAAVERDLATMNAGDLHGLPNPDDYTNPLDRELARRIGKDIARRRKNTVIQDEKGQQCK
ncbi:hypothetical protein [Alloalcanivorax xenomutans]|uniref:hypothetical protein n=1 Tax=Alloalcanivorax xenomutans TaxID=1094342 RepID=UPI00300861D5